MSKLAIVVFLVLAFFAEIIDCASADNAKNSSIDSVELKYSNPSMGPHERRVSYDLDAKTYRQELTQLLEKTTINGAMTLGNFLRVLKAQDAKSIERVQSKFKPKALGEGRTIQTLSFTFSDKTKVELNDLDTYHITGYYYSSFEKLIQDKGLKSVEEPGRLLFPAEPPRRILPRERTE